MFRTEIENFECLVNYSSYEADAARQHFEQVMRAAAEENGRRKVKMLLETHQPNVEKLQGVDKSIEEMSYEHFAAVRNSLMEIYPKTDNSYDRKLQLYALDAWQEEAEVFKKHLSKYANSNSTKMADTSIDLVLVHGKNQNNENEKSKLISPGEFSKEYCV